MDDSFDDDSFDVTDDSFDDDGAKENDSDDEQHGFKILQCYCKAKKSCYKILRTLRTNNRRDVLVENMDEYRAPRESFPSNDIYKEMNSLVIRLINMLYKRNGNVDDMEGLARRKIAMFDSKMSEIKEILSRYVDSSACTDISSTINNSYNIDYESSTIPQRFIL